MATPTITTGLGASYDTRLEYLEHHEEPYRDRAIIGFQNRDGALDSVSLVGTEFDIEYGWGGSTTPRPTMWVKSTQIISVEGNRIFQVYAEGMWMRLREMFVLPGVSGDAEDAYSSTFERTHTVEQLIQMIVEAVGFTWSGAASDGIINTYKPVFDLSLDGFESAASALYRLISMTKCYLKCHASKTMSAVYPQSSDAVDHTYYSYADPYFAEYDEKVNLLIPNSIIVLCNTNAAGSWDEDFPILTGTAQDTDSITAYTEVVAPYLAGSINNQIDANNRADAILTKLRAETLGGRMVLNLHDESVALYDRIQVLDNRV